MLCIKKRDERTDIRTEGQTDGRTNNPEAICPSNFFEVGGIKSNPVAYATMTSLHNYAVQAQLFKANNVVS